MTSRKGLQNADAITRQRVASAGGRRANELGRAYKWTPEAARAAAQKSVAARRAKRERSEP